MDGSLVLWVMVAALPACGGDGRESEEPAATPVAEPASEQGEEPVPAEPTPPLPPESVVQQLLGQAVLDHPRVQPYLHTEVAANLPLTVHAVPELSEGAPALTAGGRPVRVVAEASGARFRFTAREALGGPRVRVRFEIPAEGVTGHVDLELADFVWRPIDAQVVEH